jgi:hypothetical protein
VTIVIAAHDRVADDVETSRESGAREYRARRA